LTAVVAVLTAATAVVAAAVALTDTVTTGTGGGTLAERAAREGVLIINNNAEPVSLDPHAVSGAIDLRVAGALFEGLLANDPRTLAPVPAAAESHTVSPDGLTHTFRLRENLRWADGRPLTAGDFLFSFRRVLSPRLAAPNAAQFFVVKNARAFHEGREPDFARTGFSAPDARTVRFELEHPCANFADLVCHPAWAPVPRHVIEKFGDFDAPGLPWTRPGTITGNGPFRLAAWRVADRIEVVRNPRYWNAAAVRLNAVRFLAISDLQAEERAFRGGLLHITSTVPPLKVARCRRAEDGGPLRLDPFFSTTFVRVNTAAAPLADPRVRRALSLALRRAEIAANVMRAGETPAFCLTPPVAGGYVCAARLREDPAEARRLLAEAGYPGGRGFPTLTYLYNNHETSRLIAQAMQEMWRATLGIRVELQSQEWKTYKAALAAGTYQLARSAWSGDTLDARAFLDLFESRSEQNQTNWRDPAYDADLAAAARAPDAASRDAACQRAEARLLDALPVLPLVHNRNKFLIRPEVRGWFPNPLDIHPLSAVWLEPAPAKSPAISRAAYRESTAGNSATNSAGGGASAAKTHCRPPCE
jgi:oligopeptide transport system substrate-binding protein